MSPTGPQSLSGRKTRGGRERPTHRAQERPMIHEGYDTAQVCPNGHVATSMAASYAEHRQPYCEKCGEATIMECPKCSTPIRGHHHTPGVIGSYEYSPPSFCYKCGSAFPWTERKTQAAIDLFIEETQDQEDRRVF